MNISSTTELDKLPHQLEILLGCGINSLERIGNGKNSQVYHLLCANGKSFAIKRYFQHPADTRDRLNVEFSSLQFMWRNNVRCVPQPIVSGPEMGVAVYEYIEGKKIPSESVTTKDIDEATNFLWKVAELRNMDGSQSLPSASEASFSISRITQNITFRLNHLLEAPSSGIYTSALHTFLESEFIPTFYEVVEWCKTRSAQIGISYTDDLPRIERTLSPSDFGFHNALKQIKDGKIIFVDFEYFGWDDPSKMLCDFLLHPAMQLNIECNYRFATTIIDLFKSINPAIRERSIIVYPLFGLMWTMIMLNEFLPSGFERHQFINSHLPEREALQVSQLNKAVAMLERIRLEYQLPPLLSGKK